MQQIDDDLPIPVDPDIIERLKAREEVADQKIKEAEVKTEEAKSALAAWQRDLRSITKELRQIGAFPIASQIEREHR
jgi:hypothetical protein